MLSIKDIIGGDEPSLEIECGSKLDQHQIETPFASEIRPLRSDLQPAYQNQNEKAYHRLVAFMVAEGYNDKDIAAKVDKSPATIGYLRKQPHIEAQVLALIHGRGDAAIDVLHKAAEEAANTLIKVMRTTDNMEVKRKAANDVLDRKYGKPNQPTTTTIRKTIEEMSVAEIDQRLNELEKQREMKSN